MNLSHYREHMRAAANSAAPSSWYRIRNAVDGNESVAQIDLYDEIHPFFGVSAQQFVADLRQLDASEIQLHVNSPGGVVYDGIAIMNALRQHDARVVATVDGLAASAAGFIVVGAADELVMAENAELMLHNARGLAIGDADDMAKMADDLRRTNSNIASIYQRKAGGELDDWLGVMSDETWYSAAEAVKAGLADRVLKTSKKGDDKAATNRWDLSIFAHAGRANAPAPRMSFAQAKVPPPRKDQAVPALDDGLRKLLGVGADADDGALLNKVKALIGERDEALEEATSPRASATLPEGVMAIDAQVFADLKAQAEQGAAARVRQEEDDRARVIKAALDAGKIAPASRETWEEALKENFTRASALLDSLAAGVVPVEGTEIGTSKVPDVSGLSDDEFYNNFWPDEVKG
ncbi:head maturation protease, ClpP-related [Nocardia sp. NPDC046763]|uniref:head maturation protease, ClpP-related n=1 Tax=Nocardia sp. NPDC046763 TaxID=3155256 RepID=UPI00340A1A7D